MFEYRNFLFIFEFIVISLDHQKQHTTKRSIVHPDFITNSKSIAENIFPENNIRHGNFKLAG